MSGSIKVYGCFFDISIYYMTKDDLVYEDFFIAVYRKETEEGKFL